MLLKKYNLSISISSLSRLLKSKNMSYKKTRRILEITPTIQQSRQDIVTQSNAIGFSNIICLDEVGFQLDMKRLYGWSKKGTRCQTTLKKIKRVNYHCIFSIDNDRQVTYTVYDAPIRTDTFVQFIKRHNSTHKTLVLDNLRVHHAHIAVHEIKQKFSNILWTPPYSPEFNPIEMYFSSLKAYARKKNVSNKKELIDVIESHIQSLGIGALNKYYKHSWT